MDSKAQGKLLRAWRKHMSERTGKKITLVSLADAVADLAEAKGMAKNNRKVPGSHASMTRWELGDVDQSLTGLELIANVYGVGTMDLMKAPPTKEAAPPADDEMVRAFREFLETRKQA